MKIREFTIDYDKLSLDLGMLNAVLGFPESPLPEPFDIYLAEALDFASRITEIRAAYRLVDDIMIDPSKGNAQAAGKSFLVGKRLCKELRNSEKLIFFVCTAGNSIGKMSNELMKGEEPAKGYIFDQVGTFVAEAAADWLQNVIREELIPLGEWITNRYSPGYCDWNVADQHQLFSLFPAAPCGVTLTDSALMHPVKSVSGVIGAGKAVKYRDYPCSICRSPDCIYRSLRLSKGLQHGG